MIRLIIIFLLLSKCAFAGINPYQRQRAVFTSDGQVVMGYQQKDYMASPANYGQSYGNYGQPICYSCY